MLHAWRHSGGPSSNFQAGKRYEHFMFENVMIFGVQIVVSKKWGFTKFDKVDYNQMREDGILIPCGAHAKYINNHGPLSAWERAQERNQ